MTYFSSLKTNASERSAFTFSARSPSLSCNDNVSRPSVWLQIKDFAVVAPFQLKCSTIVYHHRLLLSDLSKVILLTAI